VIPADFASVAINANNNSFGAAVEKDAVVIVVLALDWSAETTASVASAPQPETVDKVTTANWRMYLPSFLQFARSLNTSLIG
jgi:hypothetical protein